MALLDVSSIDAYYGRIRALAGVSLRVDAGEIVTLIGANGAGKTTTLRTISGLLRPAKGAIAFDGADILKLGPAHVVRRGIGHSPEGRRVFARMTVRENLETGFAALSRDRRSIPDEIFSLFPILKDMLRRRGGDLSGGQQQQLAIARALVMRPKLIVFDEPTEGIQPSIIAQIGRTIDHLRRSGEIAIPCEKVAGISGLASGGAVICTENSFLPRIVWSEAVKATK